MKTVRSFQNIYVVLSYHVKKQLELLFDIFQLKLPECPLLVALV